MIVDYKLSYPFNYDNDYEYSIKETHSFWREVSDKYAIWDKQFDTVYNYNKETNKSEWFKGGLINACYNALDKQILNGRGNQVAFVHEIPVKRLTFRITYKQLYDQVCIFSRALINHGVSKGDVVLIYMHNSFEAIISMLSCARIGAIHSVVYNGTFPVSLSNTIDETKPKVIIASNFGLFLDDSPHYYLPLLKEALNRSTHKPDHTIIYNRNDIPDVDYNDSRLSNDQIEGSIDWVKINENLEPLLQHTPVESQHPLYLCYSSGTTNKPKGIIRETGGNTVVLNYDIRNSFGIKEGDSIYIGTPFAWVSAHSLLVYGMLMIGGTSVFSEGPIKDPSNEIFEIVSRNKVHSFVLTPLFIRRIRILDPEGINSSKYDLSNLKSILIGGEKVDAPLLQYLNQSFNAQVRVVYSQSEIGTSFIGHPIGVNIKDKELGSEIGKLSPGYKVRIVKQSEDDPSKTILLNKNEIGEIVIELPLPPCVATSLFNDSDSSLYNSSYLNKYKGYYSTGDLGYYDEDGYYYFVSRAGDSVTCGNHSINTGIIEADILSRIPLISECCIVAINDEILSSIPGVFYVLKQDSNDNKLIESIQNQISSLFFNLLQTNAKFKPVIIKLLNIPKNRNGKSIRPLLKSIFNGEQFVVPPTIENEDVINELLDEYTKFKNSNY